MKTYMSRRAGSRFAGNKIFFAATLIVLLAAGCGKSQPATQQSSGNDQLRQPAQTVPAQTDNQPTNNPPAQQATSLTPDAGAEKTFTVEGGQFYFKPNTITVNKGDKVKIIFNNANGFHDFVIDEFSGAQTKRISGGQSDTIEFTADKTGSFNYYCSVGNHRQMGMQGTLIVK